MNRPRPTLQATKEVGEMQRKLKVMTTILMVVMGLFLGAVKAPEASAAPNNSRGQCSGWDSNAVYTPVGYYNNLRQEGVVDQAAWVAQSAGYSPMDGSFHHWLKQRTIVVKLAAPARIANYGCRHGRLFFAGYKYLPKGAWVVVVIPAKYDKGDVRSTPKRGYKRVVLTVRFVAQASCSNPGKAVVHVVIYVKVTPKPRPQPKPKPKKKVKIEIRKHAFSAAAEEQLIFPTPTGVFRYKVQCGLRGKPRYIVYQSDPQHAGYCPVSAGRVLIWELTPLGPDKWKPLTPVYQTFRLKGKKVVRAVFKNKQVKEVPKTPEDVCPNIPGQQVVIPPGYVRDSAGNCVIPQQPPAPKDVCPNIPGNQETVPPGYVLENGLCVLPKTETDVCPNIPGQQVVIPPGYVRDSAGNCVIPPPAVVDVCPNLDGIQTSVPSGYVLENGLCVLPKTETDMCLNIAGVQLVVPPFYNRDQFGNCHPA